MKKGISVSLKTNTLFMVIFLSSIQILLSQEVKNISFEQDENKINIYYDLHGDHLETYNIEVYCSENDGQSWGNALENVSGDVGIMVKSGNSKKIIWDVLSEREKLTGNIKFKINAKGTVLSLQNATFTDPRDGKIYNWVQIGTQTWMAENLNFGKMINGNRDQQNINQIEKYCYNDNKENCDSYGALYQWNTAVKVCPIGWHVPSNDEFAKLTEFIGGKSKAGNKLKQEGTLHWLPPNTGATNESGFTALPAGYRNTYGKFKRQEIATIIWSSNEKNKSKSFVWEILNESEKIRQYDQLKIFGFSVRCIKD